MNLGIFSISLVTVREESRGKIAESHEEEELPEPDTVETVIDCPELE